MLQSPYYILEDFEIEPHHIRAPHWIWNPQHEKWNEVFPFLYEGLEILLLARQNVREYYTYLHNPLSDESCILYVALLDKVVDVRRSIEHLANAFCIAYKGYSLN